MTAANDKLLKLIHDTKAVSIWNHRTGPVFWYAASVPGPFYVNTELVIGPAIAETLLEKITAIVANTNDLAQRAKQLTELILDAHKKSPMYQQVITAMVDAAKSEFPAGNFDVVSGGERRDWLFSIPFAKSIGARHVFLFKNQSVFCAQRLKPDEKALHIADLINNAASYFDLWFPILAKAQLHYAGTICVNSRGTNGMQRLREHGKKTVALNSVDTGFFEKWRAGGLIDQDTLTEIKAYFTSPGDWAAQYLMQDVALFDVPGLDKKSFERLQSFFANDPWSLKKDHPDFFAAMKDEVAKRLNG